MVYILFDEGKRIGEISNWHVEAKEPVYKNVLGKTVLSTPANNQCSFESPKPVNRKSKLTVIEDGKTEIVLKNISVKGSTFVSAIIAEKNKL